MTQANRPTPHNGSVPPGITAATATPSPSPSALQTGAIVKRSVVIAGHQTSVSLEHAFWTALKQEAARRGLTINDLVTRIDSQRQGNLSSAIRVFLLEESRRPSPPTAA